MAASYHAAAIEPKKHGEAMKKKPVPYNARSGKPVSAAAGPAAADREPHARIPRLCPPGTCALPAQTQTAPTFRIGTIIKSGKTLFTLTQHVKP